MAMGCAGCYTLRNIFNELPRFLSLADSSVVSGNSLAHLAGGRKVICVFMGS